MRQADRTDASSACDQRPVGGRSRRRIGRGGGGTAWGRVGRGSCGGKKRGGGRGSNGPGISPSGISPRRKKGRLPAAGGCPPNGLPKRLGRRCSSSSIASDASSACGDPCESFFSSIDFR